MTTNFEISDSLKAKLSSAETVEEAARCCNEEGLPITAKQLTAYFSSEGDELTEEALDVVDGGVDIVGMVIKTFIIPGFPAPRPRWILPLILKKK